MPSSPRDQVPTFDKLINPTLRALHRLGGSASITELVDAMAADLKLPTPAVELQHPGSSLTELEYRSAWARNYLKNFGLIENSERGIWALTAEGTKAQETDSKALVREVQRRQRENRKAAAPTEATEPDEQRPRTWREELLDVLLELEPSAFERLCQRLLREAGFLEVEVTRRSGDGGIDGYGTIRIGGFISFNVLFQSKRYRGNIGPEIVRDFRGAMVGRADKGLIITTGGFTRDARKEATRDGAPPIDLIDGELLAAKLKELRLGVEVKTVEQVQIQESWFRNL